MARNGVTKIIVDNKIGRVEISLYKYVRQSFRKREKKTELR